MGDTQDTEKQLMVIDTDCGVDDALAILLALSYTEKWKILAITCCCGNTSVDNACNNVLKVLNLCGQKDIPVYRGCEKPILTYPEDSLIQVHGDDGLGNVAHEYSSGNLKISEGHAVNILIKLARDYPKNVNLVALAPLTNLAMAHRMDPEFTSNLKSIVFMGGNSHGIGNTTSAAEFNFAFDPEAAHIVVSETLCPTTMVPWETTLKHYMPWVSYEEFIQRSTLKAHFVKQISRHLASLQRARGRLGFLDPDLLAVAALISPSCVTETENYPLVVETRGYWTRGQAVVQRRRKSLEDTEAKLIRIITAMDDHVLLKLHENLIKIKI